MIKYYRVTFLLIFLLEVIPVTVSAQTEIPSVPVVEAVPSSQNSGEDKSTIQSDGQTLMKSLLFSDEDITAIRSARFFYEQHRNGVVNGGIAEDDFLRNLEKITSLKSDTGPKTFTYPQFFLSSIAYYSPNDWVVWINNEKITQNSGVSASGLRVTKISGEKVVVEWKPEKMDKIIDNGAVSDDGVQVDFMRNKVVFPLKANQTFSSYAMRVVEGKILPITVNLDSDISEKTLGK
jgi:hypothetical protein